MFVGSVVAGAVMLTAGGAKARGALLRDISGAFLAVAVVAVIFSLGETEHLYVAIFDS